MQNEGHRAPLVQIGSLEGDELWRRIQNLTLSDNDLMERVLVHQLVVITRLRVSIDLHLGGAIVHNLRTRRHLVHGSLWEGHDGTCRHLHCTLRRW